MKIKSFCLSMKTISRAQKTPHRMGENLYQQHFEYRLLYGFYQELQKLNTTDIKLPVNKWGNKLNRHFFKDRNTNDPRVAKLPPEKSKQKLL